jgi:hypothetical protein
MKPVSAAKFFHWTMLAKPASDRAIYRKIKKLRARSIVEIGLGDGVRAERIVQVAQKFGAGQTVKYTGIDLFDGRSEDQSPLKLIEMHKRLTALGVKPQLVPGELGSSIRRIANSHTRTDLMIVSAGFQEADLDASWFYIPRMLCAGSFLMLQNKADDNFNVMSRLDIERLAEQHTQRREAAA